MGLSVVALEEALGKIRVGRVTTALLDGVMVAHRGTMLPINTVASMSCADHRSLHVCVWDAHMLRAVEKSLMVAGWTPNTAGMVIRVCVPPPTQQRRQEWIKTIRAQGEQAKQAVRHLRREALENIKELIRTKNATTDEANKARVDIQKRTDSAIQKITSAIQRKEHDVMTV